jgi:hypothetical protein
MKSKRLLHLLLSLQLNHSMLNYTFYWRREIDANTDSCDTQRRNILLVQHGLWNNIFIHKFDCFFFFVLFCVKNLCILQKFFSSSSGAVCVLVS